NINALNRLLQSVKTAEELAEAYNGVMPGLADASGRETARDALDYCSGATTFVVGYLTGSAGLYTQMATAMNSRNLDAKNSAERFKSFKDNKGSYVGLLVANAFSHECVFAKTGEQWAFYQANRTKAKENFTLAPKLNPEGRNWCINDMSQPQFVDFFASLTDAGRAARLFPYAAPPVSWKLSVYSFAGANLLA
ncbi:MAG TPA: hypothetical protein VGP22_00035, partial [Albitalea sp.]|nr:hypothetical protein [Albitalea sp.]